MRGLFISFKMLLINSTEKNYARIEAVTNTQKDWRAAKTDFKNVALEEVITEELVINKWVK